MKKSSILHALTYLLVLLPATSQAGNSHATSLLQESEDDTGMAVEQQEEGESSPDSIKTQQGATGKMGTIVLPETAVENATHAPKRKEDEMSNGNQQQDQPSTSNPMQRLLRWGSPHHRSTNTGDATNQDGSPVHSNAEDASKDLSSDDSGDSEVVEKSIQEEGTGSSNSKHHAPPEVETVRRWGAGSGQSYTPSKPTTPKSPDTAAIPAFENHRDGFQLTARVYIGADDQLSHFDDDVAITLPYYDCNAAGSTTSPLSIDSVFFRHSIAAPTVWTSDPLDPHPTLVVVLRPFRMELDSGESKDLQAGDVILLEDAMKPGHRMIVMENHEMTMLFLTLRSPHYRTGKDNVSLQTAVTHRSSCSIDGSTSTLRPTSPLFVWNHRRIRLALVGTLALGLATVTADSLAKAAPLWLTVGLGGVCFVAGMTVGLTSAVEWSLARFQVFSERQRLYPAKRTTAEGEARENGFYDADL